MKRDLIDITDLSVAAYAETKAKKTSTRGKKDASLNFEVHYTLDENGKPLYTLYALDKNSN